MARLPPPGRLSFGNEPGTRPARAPGRGVRALPPRRRRERDLRGEANGLASDWLLLDCELMPWSAKAQQLLREQYAAVGAAGRAALAESVHALEQCSARDGAAALATTFRTRLDDVARYTDAYRRYCWAV